MPSKRLRYTAQKRNLFKLAAQPDLFCRACMIARLPMEVYTIHDPGDEKGTSLSSTDKKRLSKAPLSNIKEVPEVDEDEIAERFGYPSVNEEDEVIS